MDVADLMRQCNGKVSPSKALVKGLAKELDIDESFLNRLAEEVRKDRGQAFRGRPAVSLLEQPSGRFNTCC
jgi:hypothetical protein